MTVGIILSAGIGRRLRPLTENIPKSLIKIGDYTVIEYIIKSFLKFNINKTIVVVGHGKNYLVNKLNFLSKKLNFNYFIINNEKYGSTNTAYSLFLALEFLINRKDLLDDITIVNGDIIFDIRILENLIKCNGNIIVVDNAKSLTEESIKVIVDKNGRIADIGKALDIKASVGEFIGLSRIRKEDISNFKQILEKIIAVNPNEYYDVAFKELNTLKILYTNGLKWTEIDTIEDLMYAKSLIYEIRTP